MGKYVYDGSTGEIRDSENNELIVTVASSDIGVGERVCREMNRGSGRDEDEIGIYWCVEAVAEREDELGIDLTPAQRREVLRRIKKNHDCEVGVSWDVLDYWIAHVKEVHDVLARAA
jgi:hypothetical protein